MPGPPPCSLAGVSVSARRLALRRLIGERSVGSQAELAALLSERGHTVTQSTISRDLDAIGARKVSLFDDEVRYVVSEPPAVDDTTLGGILERYLLGATTSGTIVVLRTLPAAARVVAGAIDGSAIEGAIGTVAGDDTVLVVADEESGASSLAERILLASGRPPAH